MSSAPLVLDPASFREAMARFATGVTVVTTSDPRNGQLAGFTASAFSSLSLDPPLVLVCLDRGADCYAAFAQADAMAVSILGLGQEQLARRFATKGIDKFAGAPLEPGPVTGLPLVREAIASVECAIRDRLDGGDHVILVGRVLRASVREGDPLVHYRRSFGRFLPMDFTAPEREAAPPRV